MILMEAPSPADRRGTAGAGSTSTRSRGGDLRRFYTQRHKFYCGIDLHARTRSLGVLNQDGAIVRHRHRQAGPAPVLNAIAPDRDDLVVCVECLFTWAWLADLCTQEGSPFVLGPALYMKAIHGGQAKHDKLDAHQIAVRLRGGMLPQADVYPAELRATRDFLRRRIPCMRQRAELLAHSQNTNSPDNLPEIGTKLADKANREGVATRFPAPAVQTSIAVDLTLIDAYDRLLTDLELARVRTAKEHHAQTFYRLRSLPGIGKILALVRLYEIHDIRRFPRGQALVSYGRLVKCAKESAGNRYGTSGTKIGHTYLQWACSEAAVLFRRHNPAGPKYLARLAKKQGKGTALTVLAHTLARAVSDMLKRGTAFKLDKFLHASWSRAGEPDASQDCTRISLAAAL
jgi:transposase